jgi:hypothetical protein
VTGSAKTGSVLFFPENKPGLVEFVKIGAIAVLAVQEMERCMLSLYRAVMDPSVNPLRSLPPVQRFQMMLYLSVMWTTIFCAAAGAWIWYGEIVVAHLLVAAGFVVTGLTFRAASPAKTDQNRAVTDGATC